MYKQQSMQKIKWNNQVGAKESERWRKYFENLISVESNNEMLEVAMY